MKCELCGRKKQESKHLEDPRCVCCDVHEGQCKHRVSVVLKSGETKQNFDKWQGNRHPLWHPIAHRTEWLTDAEHIKAFVSQEQEYLTSHMDFKKIRRDYKKAEFFRKRREENFHSWFLTLRIREELESLLAGDVCSSR